MLSYGRAKSKVSDVIPDIVPGLAMNPLTPALLSFEEETYLPPAVGTKNIVLVVEESET